MKTFLQELKRRRVYRVALTYIIVASATVQLLGTVLPAFHAPDWVLQVLVFLIALGFPVALVLGWIFDLKPNGLSKTGVADTTISTDRRRVAALAFLGLVIAGFAATGYWSWHRSIPQKLPVAAESLRLAGTTNAPEIPEKSIAVIPFANLSDDKGSAYFTEGVQDEIITDLAKVADLKVISRTSVMQYRAGSERNLREIGKALGVAYILEGAVRRDERRIRVTAQLIDARNDIHIWANQYDRDLNDLFALQSDLAETIVSQLQSKLSPAEKAAIEKPPTEDADAHDLYLRANALISGPLFNVQGAVNLFKAIDLLDRAVAQDPNYHLAYCRLASAHDQIYLTGPDHTPERFELAEKAVEAARRLRPNDGNTHLALAEHLYCGFLAYDDARRELQIASQSLPNEPHIFELTGFIDRRQGRWKASIDNLAHALELDPRNTYILQQIAVSYQLMRRYEDATTALDQALRILPNDASLRLARAGLDLHQRADPAPMHQAIDEIVAADPAAAPGLADEWFFLALCERDFAAADRAIGAMTAKGYNNEGVIFSRAWCQALTARARGDAAAATKAFAQARDELTAQLRIEPNRGQSLCVLAMIDAALGRKDEAIREGRRAVELLPIDKDSINGPLIAEYLAVTYSWVGETDAALEQLQAVAAIPSDLSYGQLRLHPFWDLVRDNPRFQQIVASQAPSK